MLFLPLLLSSAAAISPPETNVEIYDGYSQVTNVAVSCNDTTTIKYLGNVTSSDDCQQACLSYPSRCWSFTYHNEDHDTLPTQCFGLTAPRFSPTPENATVSGVANWFCRSDSDCSYNGVCQNNGVCGCEKAWSGHRCQTLKLLPDSRHSGYRGTDNKHNTSSWGGAVLKGPDGKFHMWSAEMTEHCGIGAWAQNSRIIRAVSDTPGGSYSREEVVYEVFSHEPEVVSGPNGEYVMFFTAALRSEHGDCNCCRPESKCDGSTGPGDCPATLPLRDNDPSYMSYATSPEGPWSAPQQLFPKYVGADTNFAPVILKNGSIVAIWREWDDIRGSRCFLALGDNWNDTSSYIQYDKKELFPDLGPAGTEDPFLYTDKNGIFHSVFHHMYGYDTLHHWWLLAEGGHAFSENGIDWTYTGIAWGDPFDRQRGNVVHYTDGSTFRFTRRERPHLIFDEDMNPTHLITAAQYGTGKIPTTTNDNGDASYTLVQEIGHAA